MQHVARMKKTRNAYKIVIAMKGKKLLGRLRRRCEDNIKIH
jgi:hypothetical protein